MPVCCRASLLAVLLVNGSTTTLTRPARAEGAMVAEQDAARERFKQGAQAYSEGRYKDAIDLFLDADRLKPNPAFAYNIGLAYEELGDAANALRWYRAYLRDLPGAPDQAEVEQRIVAAEKHLSDRGVQQVTVLSSPIGATVSLDGRRVGVAPWTAELAPGKHVMGLELHGFRDGSASFDLPLDRAMDVAVVLQPLPDTTTATVVRPVAPPPPESTRPWPTRVHAVTWATLGVGALGAALGLEFARAHAVDTARQAPTNLVGKEDYDRARGYETGAKILAGGGGAVALLGSVLLYLDLSSSSGSAPRVGAVVGGSRQSCGLRLDGVF